jgi:RHS repeat-associated protein
MYAVYSDHLDTHRMITRQSDQTIVWRWDTAEAFGASTANENSSSLGVITFNQRFPGQTFDSETGLNQNWNREYDPRQGRYRQSDPIGLKGGINTYAYANGAPLMFTDPTGEFINLPGIAIGVGLEVAMQAYKNYSDGCDLLDTDNYDFWNIGVAGAVGAFAPGMGSAANGLWPKWMPFVGKSRGPGGAIKELWGQLDRANTANRVAKVASRIEKNGMVVADNLTYNAAYQAGKKAISNGSGNRDCTCQR